MGYNFHIVITDLLVSMCERIMRFELNQIFIVHSWVRNIGFITVHGLNEGHIAPLCIHEIDF